MSVLDAIMRLGRAATHRLSARTPPVEAVPQPQTYARWIAEYDTLTAADHTAIHDEIKRLPKKPRLTLVVTAQGMEQDAIAHTMQSVRTQLYPEWEAYVLGGAKAGGTETRVHHLDAGDLIGAIKQAQGDYIALVEAGDLLSPHALFMMARDINLHPEADILYSDEDQIDPSGQRRAPFFKGGWNPDLFLGQDFACRLGMMRTRAVLNAARACADDRSQDAYGLMLAMIEAGALVRHLPFVLYHRRKRDRPPEAGERERLTVEDHLHRRYGPQAPTVGVSESGHRHIVWPLPDPEPPVSLIIPTRDRIDLIKVCVEGLRYGTAYQNLEIIAVDNNSVERETLDYFDSLKADARIRILPYKDPFNFSAINNFAVRHARGEVIGFINNDIKVIEPGWLREMVSHAMRPDVGAVGAMLYYGDDTIQHAGVVLGIGGVGSHVFKRQPKDGPGYACRTRLAQDISAVTAACMLVRRKVFDEVGGLDAENLTVAYNDVDLCLRIRAAGYRVVWTPFARLYHLESATRGGDRSGVNKPRFEREKAYMLKRWGPILQADPYYSPNLALDRLDCRPAFPPRVTLPWKRQS